MRNLFFLFATVIALAAPPTVTCSGTDAAGEPRGVGSIGKYTAQFNCTISATGYYSRIEYGTTSGVYPDRSKTGWNVTADTVTQTTQIRMSLGGLKPGTTYYARAAAHPNQGNLTDVGYSSEMTFTTLPETTPDPSFPSPPATTWTPTINTSGYTSVLLKRCPSGYACANGAVPAAGVADNDLLSTILAAVPYGTVIEAPLGLDVNVEIDSSGGGSGGYRLPAKAVQGGKSGVDDPTHQWIVLQTQGCDSSASLPPPGARIDTTFSGKAAIFRTTAQSSLHAQHFEAKDVAAHHYAIRCLELAFPSPASDEVSPVAYNHAIYLSKNNSPSTALKYFVIDRNIISGATGLQRVYGGIYCGADYCSVTGNDLRIHIWRLASIPTGTPTVGGTGTRTLTVPSGSTYKIRSTDGSANGCASGATATVTSLGTTGKYVFTLGASGCKLYFDNRAVSLASCTNCTGVGAAADPTGTTPSNEYTYIFGSFSSAGAMSLDTIVNSYDYYAPNQGAITFGMELGSYAIGPFDFENNYISANGIGWYADGAYGGSAYDPNDGIVRRNWFNLPPSYQWNHASTNGLRYYNRQHLEWKRGRRWLVAGNRFSGNISQQNQGPSIFLSGRGNYLTSDGGPLNGANLGNGISDFEIRSNIISHGASGWDCSFNQARQGDAVPPQRIQFENNLLYGLSMFTHSAPGAAALSTPYFSSISACQEILYRNNTHGVSAGTFPGIVALGGNDIRGTLRMVDNIFYYSKGDTLCSREGVLVDDSAYDNPTYPRLPAVSGGTPAALIDSMFATVAGGAVTARNTVSNNVMVGGVCTVDSVSSVDLSQAETTTAAAGWKSGNLWPSGATMAARETAAGITSPSTYDFRLTTSSPYVRAAANLFDPIGANIPKLLADLGIVQDISVAAGYQSITARYLAPDTRACSLDVSSNSGSTWTRATDAGGARQRTVSVTGLTASTAYTWRLLCYYQQVNDGRQWDNWPTSQLTTGSVTTAPSNTMTLSVAYNLSAITGATKARITVYMADGSSTVTTCTSSPCSVAFTRSAVESRMDALSAADAVLVTGDRQAVTLQ